MKNNFYKILCLILLIIIFLLIGILAHYHFADPGKAVWKDSELSDTLHIYTVKTHSNN